MDEQFCPQDVLDGERWKDIRHQSALIANLWLRVIVASETGDAAEAREACQLIAKLTKPAFAVVKEIGAPAPETPMAKSAREWRAEHGNG